MYSLECAEDNDNVGDDTVNFKSCHKYVENDILNLVNQGRYILLVYRYRQDIFK